MVFVDTVDTDGLVDWFRIPKAKVEGGLQENNIPTF